MHQLARDLTLESSIAACAVFTQRSEKVTQSSRDRAPSTAARETECSHAGRQSFPTNVGQELSQLVQPPTELPHDGGTNLLSELHHSLLLSLHFHVTL